MQSFGFQADAWSLVMAAIFLSTLAACAEEHTSAVPDPHIAAVADLPMTFEMNRGQTSNQVRFLYHGPQLQIFFTDSGAVLNLLAPEAKPVSKAAHPIEGVALSMTFAGVHAFVVEGEQRVASKSNYLVGSPDQWRTGIAHYTRVRYRNVAPGVDLVFYGNQKNLEYDWIVASGADPSRLRMHFDGADQILLDRSGNLILRTKLGDIEQKRPTVYQRAGNRRVAVRAQYVVSGLDVSLVVGRYEPHHALVIDPVLAYATFLGSSMGDSASAVAVDGSGSAYIAGTTSSLNFPVTPGAYQAHLNGNENAFVSKLNPTGTSLEYSTYFGGNGYYYGNGIAVDSSGNAYLSGQLSNSTDFPGKIIGFMNPNIFTAYLAKLNANGSALVYALAWGGATDGCAPPFAFGFGTAAYAVAVDRVGGAWITGATTTTDFPTTFTAYQHSWGGGCDFIHPIQGDAFVSVVSPDGSGLAYSTYIGGYGLDWGDAIALDGNGNAYITGANVYGGYPTTFRAFMRNYPSTSNGSSGIITKLSIEAKPPAVLSYSTYLGGSDQSQGSGISLDNNGDAFVTGLTTTSDFPTTAGVFKQTFPYTGDNEVFVTKMNPSGSALVYSTFLGAGTGNAIAVAPDTGLAFVTGGTNNSTGDFPITKNAFQKVLRDSYGNAFVSEFNATGSRLLLSSYLGGSTPSQYGYDSASAIALDHGGNIYVVGQVGSSNFPVTYKAFQTKTGDAFAAKIAASCTPAGTAPLVDFCTPTEDATVPQKVTVQIVSIDPSPVTQTSLYADGKLVYSQPLTSLQATIDLSPGPHQLMAQAHDTSGKTLTRTIAIVVK